MNGEVNRHNCRYWAAENPYWIEQTHTQRPQKLNVWAGIMGNRIIEPFFIDGTLNGQRYLDLLENLIVPAIVTVIEDGDIDFDSIFQQDGTSPPPIFTHQLGIISIQNSLGDGWADRCQWNGQHAHQI